MTKSIHQTECSLLADLGIESIQRPCQSQCANFHNLFWQIRSNEAVVERKLEL